MNYVGLDHDRSGNVLYLKIKYTKVEKEPVEKEEKKEEGHPSKLAIGVEGGFDVGTGKRWETVKEYGLVIYPRLNDVLAFPPKDAGLDIPMSIAAAVEAIIKRDDAFKVSWVRLDLRCGNVVNGQDTKSIRVRVGPRVRVHVRV